MLVDDSLDRDPPAEWARTLDSGDLSITPVNKEHNSAKPGWHLSIYLDSINEPYAEFG